jgi:hypothetical protein
MQTSWLSRIERWADEPGFRNQTLDHASSALHELLPAFPAPSDQPTEICVNGFRWFNGEMEAVADAIHAAGLWAVPGCSRLQTRDTRRNGWLPRTEPEASNRAVR